MARLVHDRDGRQWVVATTVAVRDPDVPSVTAEPLDRVLGAVLLGVSVLLALTVVLTVPASLDLPAGVVTVVLLLVAVGVAWWWLRLPRTVRASSQESLELGAGPDVDPEELERRVRGPWAARREADALSRWATAFSADPERDLAGDLPHRS